MERGNENLLFLSANGRITRARFCEFVLLTVQNNAEGIMFYIVMAFGVEQYHRVAKDLVSVVGMKNILVMYEVLNNSPTTFERVVHSSVTFVT